MKYSLPIDGIGTVSTILPDTITDEAITNLLTLIRMNGITFIYKDKRLSFVIDDMPANPIIIKAINALPDKDDRDLYTTALNALVCLTWNVPETTEEAIKRIASLPPIERDSAIAEFAKEKNCKVNTILSLVSASLKSGRNDEKQSKNQELISKMIRMDEACAGSVDVAAIFDEIRSYFHSYLYMAPENEIVATCWVLYTHFIDDLKWAPMAHITAPESECGKSELMFMLQQFSYRPFITSRISTSAMMRIMDEYKPTLFLDEADINVKFDETKRSIFDAGVDRRSSVIPISVPTPDKNWEAKPFDCFGPKCVCGIGELHQTITSRSIVFRITRKPGNEIRLFSSDLDLEKIKVLQSKIARLRIQCADEFRSNKVKIDDKEFYNRNRDRWEPLFRVALLAGSEKLNECIEAAKTIEAQTKAGKPHSIKVQLIEDMWDIFEQNPALDQLSCSDLITGLIADDEKPWLTFGSCKGAITPYHIAMEIKKFQIPSITSHRYNPKPGIDYQVWLRKDIETLYNLYNSRE